LTLEHLRSVVGFRGYAQRDPLNEYKNESFQLFESLLDGLRGDVTQSVAAADVSDIDFSNVSRNDDCPCGSGKKFKHCHGAR